MINEENLNKLYEGLIRGDSLTTKNLNSYGFNSQDLKKLITQKQLTRIKRGYYAFQSVDALFFYGKTLIKRKEYQKATECFKKCYELNPRHLGICFQLFLRSIYIKDYESSFKYFDSLFYTKNLYYKADSNFHLYLLNMITDIPKKYKEYMKNLKIEDIYVDVNDKRYKNTIQQNRMRYEAFHKSFPHALKKLNSLTMQQGMTTLPDMVNKILLIQVIEEERKSQATLIEFAKNEKYKEIVFYLKAKQTKYHLGVLDSYTLKLANQIVDLQNTKEIPQKTIFQTKNLFKAIDGHNYDLALSLTTNYSEKENVINILLSYICDLSKKIDKKQPKILNTKLIEHSNDDVSFSNITDFLLKFDLENALDSLKKYLVTINQQEYEFLIADLIKISLIEKDKAFTKPLVTLTYISRENFKFDISNYIQAFYIALNQSSFEEARIYLDIISKSNKFHSISALFDNLLQVLNDTEAFFKQKKNNSDVKCSDQDSAVKKIPITFPKKVTPEEKLIQIPKTKISRKTENKDLITKKMYESDQQFIDSKHALLLENKGIILLKHMDEVRRKNIYDIASKYSDIDAFDIGPDDKKQIVLRYINPTEDYIDARTLINNGNLAYKEGNYNSCIENYLQLLQIKKYKTFERPRSFAYVKLGLAYMRNWQKAKAIDYLIVATELSNQEGRFFEFSGLISLLNGTLNYEDYKSYFRMDLKDFENDIQNYYGIENFDKITSYILETGLDVETACHELNMQDEEIEIIRLIYARKFYSQGNYKKGDQFLKVVEESKNKTKFTINLLEEIRKNKKFYIHRRNKDSKQLVLTLQPKK